MGVILILILLLTIPDPPPAVVRICGEDNNGITVLHRQVNKTKKQLLAQGCFAEDIHIEILDANYSFVWGHKVLIGETGSGSNER